MRAVLIMNPASGMSTLATTEGTPQEHKESWRALNTAWHYRGSAHIARL